MSFMRRDNSRNGGYSGHDSGGGGGGWNDNRDAGRGGGGGGRGANNNNNNNNDFGGGFDRDGTGGRPGGPKEHKFIDPGCEITRELTETRLFAPDNASAGAFESLCMGPSKLYQQSQALPTSLAARANPEVCLATRFCHTCPNRARCPIFSVTWTRDGRRLISGGYNGDINVWSGLGFMPESTISSHRVAIRTLEYNKSGDYLLSGDNDGAIKISNTQFRAMIDLDAAHSAPVRDLSFSPTDTKFVSASDDLSLKIWDFKTHAEERKLMGHGLDIKSVDWHPSSALLLSGARDNLIKLWDPRLGSRHGEILTVSGHKQGITQVSWNPHNGNWFLSASRDQSIRIHDLRMVRGGISTSSTRAGTGATETGDRALHVLRAHAAEVHACAWHPVHEQLMASGGYDGVLMFWILGPRCGGADSVTPMEETLSLKGENDIAPGMCEDPVVQAIVPAAHDDAIWSMAWHPLGNMLCTSSNDHTCKFWSRERPGADGSTCYSGFNQRDVTELDVYERLQVLPPSEERVKKDAMKASKRAREGGDLLGIAKRKAIARLAKTKIPGLGPIGTLNKNIPSVSPVGLVCGAVLTPPTQPYLPRHIDGVLRSLNAEFVRETEREKVIRSGVMPIDGSNEQSGAGGSGFVVRAAGGMQGGTAPGAAALSSMLMTTSAGPTSGHGNKGGDRGGGFGSRGGIGVGGGERRQHENNMPPVSLDSLKGERIGGFLRYWDEDKGCGFIQCDEEGRGDCFAHISDLLNGYGKDGEQRLTKGDRVVFKVELGVSKTTGKEQSKAKDIVHADHVPEFKEGPNGQNGGGPRRGGSPSGGPPGGQGGFGAGSMPPMVLLFPGHDRMMQLLQELTTRNAQAGEIVETLQKHGFTREQVGMALNPASAQ